MADSEAYEDARIQYLRKHLRALAIAMLGNSYGYISLAISEPYRWSDLHPE